MTMISSREANARQRLQLMQHSGVSQHITAMHTAERLAAEAAQEAARNCDRSRRYTDLDTVRTMLLLITGAEQIQGNQAQQRKRLDYQENKELVTTLIGASPRGKRSWTGALGVAAQMAYAGVPSLLNSAASVIAQRTGMESIGTAVKVIDRARELSDAGLTAVTTAPIPVPSSVAAGITGNNANLVQQCLNWWMSPSAASAIATYLPTLQLLAHASAAVTVFNSEEKIGSMLGLLNRHDGSCTCCQAIAAIASDWMDNTANTAAQLHAILAPVLLARDTYDKISHYVRKKRAGPDGDVHRGSYHLARQLWAAAQTAPASHRVFEPCFTMVNPGGRCPLALLTLATLFGAGDAEAGVAKAVAAIVSDENSAVSKVKELIRS
jgi:hypothetical protein